MLVGFSMGEVRREGARRLHSEYSTRRRHPRQWCSPDVDAFADDDLPVADLPHEDGPTLAEGRELLGPLLGDPRIRIIEVTEYSIPA